MEEQNSLIRHKSHMSHMMTAVVHILCRWSILEAVAIAAVVVVGANSRMVGCHIRSNSLHTHLPYGLFRCTFLDYGHLHLSHRSRPGNQQSSRCNLCRLLVDYRPRCSCHLEH